jgi:hypothetical protein
MENKIPPSKKLVPGTKLMTPEFLKELDGRDFAEYANSVEAEQDKKIRASTTPEYLKMWAEGKKEVDSE